MVQKLSDHFTHEIAGRKMRPDAHAFYATLGYSLAAWQSIETKLCAVCACAVAAMETKAFNAVFYETRSFATRLKMTSQAIRYSRASSETKEAWKALVKKLETASKTRNKLIHGMVVFVTSMDQFVISADWNDPKSHPEILSGNSGLSKADIEVFARVSRELHGDVQGFSQTLINELNYFENVQAYTMVGRSRKAKGAA